MYRIRIDVGGKEIVHYCAINKGTPGEDSMLNGPVQEKGVHEYKITEHMPDGMLINVFGGVYHNREADHLILAIKMLTLIRYKEMKEADND